MSCFFQFRTELLTSSLYTAYRHCFSVHWNVFLTVKNLFFIAIDTFMFRTSIGLSYGDINDLIDRRSRRTPESQRVHSQKMDREEDPQVL